VLKSVDALFTAVTAADARLLEQCEDRLQVLHDAGKLPAAAARHLGRVIDQARAGRRQDAAQRLFDFVRAQRRDRPSPASRDAGTQ
jgi:hypothetical protein